MSDSIVPETPPVRDERARAIATLISRFMPKMAFSSRNRSPISPLTQPVKPASSEVSQTSWSLEDHRQYRESATFPDSSPAHHTMLRRDDGLLLSLDQLAGKTTLVLLVSHEMSILPGIDHRISRRAGTLGQGVQLVCVSEHVNPAIPSSFIDPDRQIRAMSGGHNAPILLSLDQRGNVFDIVTNVDSIVEWLWDDPRPHSMRASGSVALDDMMA